MTSTSPGRRVSSNTTRESISRVFVAPLTFSTTFTGFPTAGAADDLGVDLDATGLCERVDLQIDSLILSADACIPHVHGHPPDSS
jgi:hypothetical protein